MTDREFWADCPDVEIDAKKMHGEPTVGPIRVEVRTLIEAEELGDTPEQMAEDYQLPVDKVRSILAYYHAHQPEPAPSR